MKTQITIYGFGYVGQAVYRFLKNHYEIQIFDPNPSKTNVDVKIISERKKLAKSDYAVICVPTPSKKDGSCDTSLVEKIVKNSNHKFYLIKSTVVPDTTASLAKSTKKIIAMSPEFIGEGKYHIPHYEGYMHPTDIILHPFYIFGGDKKATKEWVKIWQKVGGWSKKYLQTTSNTAELIKYAENSFLAVTKMYWDQIYDLAQTFGVDYDETRELILQDKRITPAMSIIYENNRGFAGKCLPKDVLAIVKKAEKSGLNPHFLKAVLASNKKLQKNNTSEGTLDYRRG